MFLLVKGTLPEVNVTTTWVDMADSCTVSMRRQIQEELKAAMQYMAMGAHFSKDSINRPGFAKMFFESASEERDHAIKLISYLLMRGGLTKEVSNLIEKNVSTLHLLFNLVNYFQTIFVTIFSIGIYYLIPKRISLSTLYIL